MKFLITGGAGFIGPAVIRYLIKELDYKVVNLDNLTYAGNRESISDIESSPLYQFEKADICNASDIERVFNQHQPDRVKHLVAEAHVDRSSDGSGQFIPTIRDLFRNVGA